MLCLEVIKYNWFNLVVSISALDRVAGGIYHLVAYTTGWKTSCQDNNLEKIIFSVIMEELGQRGSIAKPPTHRVSFPSTLTTLHGEIIPKLSIYMYACIFTDMNTRARTYTRAHVHAHAGTRVCTSTLIYITQVCGCVINQFCVHFLVVGWIHWRYFMEWLVSHKTVYILKIWAIRAFL